jgi:ubiquitin C-terminal hydrolase
MSIASVGSPEPKAPDAPVKSGLNLAKIQRVALAAMSIGICAVFAQEYLAAKTLVNFVVSSAAGIFGLQEFFLLNIDQSIFSTATLVTSVVAGVLCSAFMIKALVSFSLIKVAAAVAYFCLMSRGINEVTESIESSEKAIESKREFRSANKKRDDHSGIFDKVFNFYSGSPISTEQPTKGKGFVNSGNTCWMNAALKSIVTNPHYVKRIKVSCEKFIIENEKKPSDDLKEKIRFLEKIVLLADEYKKPEHKFRGILEEIRKDKVLIGAGFTLRSQWDAGEFLRVLDGIFDLSNDPTCSIGMRRETYSSLIRDEASIKCDPAENIIKLTTWTRFNESHFNFESFAWQAILNATDLAQLPDESAQHFALRKKLKDDCGQLQLLKNNGKNIAEKILEIENNPIFRSIELVDDAEQFIEALRAAVMNNSSSTITLKKLLENFDKERSIEDNQSENLEKLKFYHPDIDSLKMITFQLPRFICNSNGSNRRKDKSAIEGITSNQTIKVVHPETLKESTVELEVSSIVCHSGDLAGGHYYSYVKEDGEWYEHNDSYYTVTTEAEINEKEATTAYIVNYNVVRS